MTQTTQEARPVSDVSTGSWQVTPLYSKINEKNPDDSSYVTSAPAPTSDSFTVALGPLQCPQQGTGKLTVRLRQTGTPALSVLIELVQSGTVVASQLVGNPATDFVAVTLPLTAEQLRAITDYTTIQVRVTAQSEQPIYDCNECAGGAAAEYRMTGFAGITNGILPNCADLEGKILTHGGSGDPCRWHNDDFPEIMRSTLNLTALPVRLSIFSSVEYVCIGTFNCLGSNTFEYEGPAGLLCADWPATITVAPA